MSDLQNMADLVSTGNQLLDDIRGGAISRMAHEHQTQQAEFKSEHDTKQAEFKSEHDTQQAQHAQNHAEQVALYGSTLATLKERYNGMTANDLLTMPLNKNAFLQPVDGKSPLDGFGAMGSVEIEAVHPFTKGFEGPYLSDAPAEVAETIDEATQEKPFYYGRYYKGPRASRGGLSDGYGGVPNGNILKIFKPAGEHHFWKNSVFINVDSFKHNQLRFRAYVYVARGPASFDVSYLDDGGQITIPSVGQWHFIDEVITKSEVTKGFLTLNIDHADECELYIAMLNIHAIQGAGNDATIINRKD
ncbi:hypothetical protein BB427_11295 [Pseudoalteromonas sp. BMB]|uniref:hypothetical protein n=1 Tax=Pseudoalteromonas sp. BMB TaxID=1874619 RepID=UPI00083E3DCA|nr:hypothetical protein [Pseudoalteromonas sp. BMB]ODB41069.1 hypothetical protein BB427_11295 [Pseudoalteromonas sp. BMB]